MIEVYVPGVILRNNYAGPPILKLRGLGERNYKTILLVNGRPVNQKAIHGFSNKLADNYGNNIDDEGKRIVKIISDNTVKMGRLIDDLLEFSRIGRSSISLSEVNMGNIVNEICKTISSGSTERDINFEIEPLASAYCDGKLIRQVLFNLISNAVKFTNYEKKATIKIGCKEKEKEVIYFVQDNGAGFDMKYVDKLFQVF